MEALSTIVEDASMKEITRVGLNSMSTHYLDMISNRGAVLSDSLFGLSEPVPCTSGYVRVSTTGQITEKQIQEIEAAGFQVEPRRVVTERFPAAPPSRAALPGCWIRWSPETSSSSPSSTALVVMLSM
jgi:hypothetical protein